MKDFSLDFDPTTESYTDMSFDSILSQYKLESYQDASSGSGDSSYSPLYDDEDDDAAEAMQEKLPTGVIATERGGAAFVQNYSGKTQQVTLDGSYEEMLTGEVLSGTQEMPVNGIWVLRKQK